MFNQRFEGRLILEDHHGHQTATPKQWTVEQIIGVVQDGGYGMISLMYYEIDGKIYPASGLSLGEDMDIRVENGNIIVQTYFQRKMIAGRLGEFDDPDEPIFVEVIVDPMSIEYVSMVQKIQRQNQFIAVFTDGGLISTFRMYTDLREAVQYMMHTCDEHFDPETDDARIFDADGDELYVQPNPGELEEEEMGVYYCPKCQIVERSKNLQTVFCTECLGDMERLDQKS